MGFSWVLYIGRGRLADAAEERILWRPVEFNGVVVSSLESAPRGRGNRGGSRYRRGGGGGVARDTRRNDSRSDGRWQRDIGPEEGDEGGVGRVCCKGRVGPMTRWPSLGNGK
jgi:hypothetical protein